LPRTAWKICRGRRKGEVRTRNKISDGEGSLGGVRISSQGKKEVREPSQRGKGKSLKREKLGQRKKTQGRAEHHERSKKTNQTSLSRPKDRRDFYQRGKEKPRRRGKTSGRKEGRQIDFDRELSIKKSE